MACCDAWIGHSVLHCGCSNSHFLLCLWLEAEGKEYVESTQLPHISSMIPWYLWMRSENKVSDIITRLWQDTFLPSMNFITCYRFHTVPLIIPSSCKFWMFSTRYLLQTFEVLILSFVQSPDYGTIFDVGSNVAIWEQVSIGGTTVGHFVIVCAL